MRYGSQEMEERSILATAARCAAARTAPKARGMDLSSAALAAQQEFVDSRIMFSIGKAWIDMENNGIIWFGIPLSVTGKSKYYDR